MKIQREANAKAQKEGIIAAHENWSTITEHQKDRSGKVVKAYEKTVESVWADITNPDNRYDLKLQEVEGAFFSANENEEYDLLGVDYHGNPITADTSTMSPMELVMLNQSMSATRTAIEQARDDVKSARTIEGAKQQYIDNSVLVLEEMLGSKESLLTQSLSMIGVKDEVLTKARFERLAELANIAKDSGVEETSTLLLQAIDDRVSDFQEEADVIESDPKEQIEDLISGIQENLSLREQDGTKIMFASKGSDYHNKLNSLKESAHKRIDKRLSDLIADQDGIKELVLNEAYLMLDEKIKDEQGKDTSELKYNLQTVQGRKNYLTDLRKFSKDNNYLEFNKIMTTVDDIIEIETVRPNMENNDVSTLYDNLLQKNNYVSSTTRDEDYTSVKKLFDEKKIDATLFRQMNSMIESKSREIVYEASAKERQKPIDSWTSDETIDRELGAILHKQKGIVGDYDPDDPMVTVNPFIYGLVGTEAESLLEAVQNGTNHKIVNPLAGLEGQKKLLVSKQLGGAFEQYNNWFNKEIIFDNKPLNQKNYRSRNRKASQTMRMLAEAYVALQIAEESFIAAIGDEAEDSFTAQDLIDHLEGLGNDNK